MAGLEVCTRSNQSYGGWLRIVGIVLMLLSGVRLLLPLAQSPGAPAGVLYGRGSQAQSSDHPVEDRHHYSIAGELELSPMPGTLLEDLDDDGSWAGTSEQLLSRILIVHPLVALNAAVLFLAGVALWSIHNVVRRLGRSLDHLQQVVAARHEGNGDGTTRPAKEERRTS